jgi:hypothetical protein
MTSMLTRFILYFDTFLTIRRHDRGRKDPSGKADRSAYDRFFFCGYRKFTFFSPILCVV